MEPKNLFVWFKKRTDELLSYEFVLQESRLELIGSSRPIKRRQTARKVCLKKEMFIKDVSIKRLRQINWVSFVSRWR